MKYFLAAACIWSFQATAQEICPSVWVFHANKTCAHMSNGPDTSKPGAVSTVHIWSGEVRGGKDQLQICQGVRAAHNEALKSQGATAELAKAGPIAEDQRRSGVGKVTYRYLCELNVTNYPAKVAASPACGQEEKWSYQVEGEKPAGANCLSCENLQAAAPEATVKCLKTSITEIIEPKAIELRDSDIAAVKTQAKRMLKMNKEARAISNLQSTQDISLFMDFVDQK